MGNNYITLEDLNKRLDEFFNNILNRIDVWESGLQGSCKDLRSAWELKRELDNCISNYSCFLENYKEKMNEILEDTKKQFTEKAVIEKIEKHNKYIDSRIKDFEIELKNVKKAMHKICDTEKLAAIQEILDKFDCMVSHAKEWIKEAKYY